MKFIPTLTKKLSQITLISQLFSRFTPKSDKQAILVILLHNFLPVLGAIFLGWNIADILIFLWIDNVVMGLFHALKIFMAGGGKYKKGLKYGNLSSLISAAGFLFQWGAFCLVHGVLSSILSLIILAAINNTAEDPFLISDYDPTPLVVSFVALTVFYMIDFLKNYMLNDAYKKARMTKMSKLPFGQMIVLHLAILAVGFVFGFVGIPIMIKLEDFDSWKGIDRETLSTVANFVFSLLGGIATGIIKTWWDYRVFFYADELGDYTTDLQKKASKTRRKQLKDTTSKYN